jgi:hypothetical protein
MNRAVVEGTVVAVASDRAHRFSKPLRDAIMLAEGHGVEGDAHAGPFVRHRYLARRRPSLANLRQVHLIPGELFDEMRRFGYDLRSGELGDDERTGPGTVALGKLAEAGSNGGGRTDRPSNAVRSHRPVPDRIEGTPDAGGR